MSTFGTRARRCTSAKSSEQSSCSSDSSSHKHVAAVDTDAKHRGTIPVMSKLDMHKFDHYGEPSSTLPMKNKKQEVEQRSHTLPVQTIQSRPYVEPVPRTCQMAIQCVQPEAGRLY
ncbi:uncharacterized protein F5147DRAFT_775858 [Suillus discolor]|uniref:Uncharacterized protein n=1 Tax=Suillus discolor TaxID=1912936 RepID=A0A9P7F3Z4_9AGAM|nr:uncharacterized protein F5147DRAFT_775858 [Suillus discolor]KAG2103732.1 hypothetical protein F5147DRAFT_775858 [Suillus discolor]